MTLFYCSAEYLHVERNRIAKIEKKLWDIGNGRNQSQDNIEKMRNFGAVFHPGWVQVGIPKKWDNLHWGITRRAPIPNYIYILQYLGMEK